MGDQQQLASSEERLRQVMRSFSEDLDAPEGGWEEIVSGSVADPLLGPHPVRRAPRRVVTVAAAAAVLVAVGVGVSLGRDDDQPARGGADQPLTTTHERTDDPVTTTAEVRPQPLVPEEVPGLEGVLSLFDDVHGLYAAILDTDALHLRATAEGVPIAITVDSIDEGAVPVNPAASVVREDELDDGTSVAVTTIGTDAVNVEVLDRDGQHTVVSIKTTLADASGRFGDLGALGVTISDTLSPPAAWSVPPPAVEESYIAPRLSYLPEGATLSDTFEHPGVMGELVSTVNYRWLDDDGRQSFVAVTVVVADGAAADHDRERAEGVFSLTGTPYQEIDLPGGRSALYTEVTNAAGDLQNGMRWVERADVSIQISGTNVSRATLTEIAEGVTLTE